MWAPPIALLSQSMEQIHARFVIHMSNDTGLVKVILTERCHFHTRLFKYTKFYIILYLLILRISVSKNVTGYIGRNSHQLHIPRMRTIYGQKSLFYRGVVAWNNIDQSLYLATSLKTFKLSYKLYCIVD